MKSKRVLFFALLVLLSGLLTACSAQSVSNWPGLSSDGKNAYLSNGSQIYIVSLSDGKETTTVVDGKAQPLRYPLSAQSGVTLIAAPAFTADGLMVVGNANSNPPHDLYAVDPATGNVSWTYSDAGGPWMASALVTDTKIYVPNNDGNLYAFDAATKNFLWKAVGSEHSLWSQPVADGQNVYVASLDHAVYAVDAATGNSKWKTELDSSLLSAPLVANGTLYIGTLTGELYALNTQDGTVRWKSSLNGSIWSAPVLNGDMLYLGTVNGQVGTLYAINATTGTTTWSHDEAGSIIASPLMVDNQIIYVTEAGLIQSLDQDGKSNWQATIKGKIYTTPVLVGDLILVAPMQGDSPMFAFDKNGQQKWNFTPGK